MIKNNTFQFGKFIDDLRIKNKYFNVSFEKSLFGEAMIITVPNKPYRSIIIDTDKIGEVNYGSEFYYELVTITNNNINNMLNN